MKELLEKLIQSQRERLDVYRFQIDKQLKLKEIESDYFIGDYLNNIKGKISELELCLSQSINLYNQIKNDSESPTTE